MRARRVAPVRRSALAAVACVAVALGAAQLADAGPARADTSGSQPTGLHDGMMPPGSADAAVQTVAAGTGGTGGQVGVAATPTVGPDVASYQHPGGAAIDWLQVAASGQTFAIVKATELYTGSDGAAHLYTNPYLTADISGAHAAGLIVGAYTFAHPENSAMAQADAFAGAIGTLPAGSLPPVLDLEVSGGLSTSQLVSWTQTFLDRLQLDTGVLPMIYTGPGFWSSYLGGSTAFARYPLWEAHYTTASAPARIGGWATYNLWQYTSSASIAGISGSVDQSRFNGSAPASLAVRAMPSTVTAPAVLSAGQSLVSPHQQYRLVMQADGNLVMSGNGAALWSTGTWGHPGASASLQPDGNLVVYGPDGTALWNSGSWTAGPGVVLSVGDDGDVTLVSPSHAVVWDEGGNGSDRLYPGGSLVADQYVASPDGHSKLVMQSDGNLVEYADGSPLWSSGTWGNPGARAVMQSDGNLVVYAPGNRAVWWSSSWTSGGSSSLVVHDGGDVTVTLPGGRVAWHDGSPGADRLRGPDTLAAGQELSSPDGQYRLDMQGDGNLVEYGNGRPLWSSGTYGHPGASVSLQLDGNLVVYGADGSALWSSGTWGAGPGLWLSLQDDGDLTLVAPDGSLRWHRGSAGSDLLSAGSQLAAGQFLHDPAGSDLVILQGDGNLVVYRSGVARWSSGTWGHPGAHAVLQSDGNLVVYSASGTALWNSGTWGTGPLSTLAMQGDGNLVVYSVTRAVWNAGTYG